MEPNSSPDHAIEHDQLLDPAHGRVDTFHRRPSADALPVRPRAFGSQSSPCGGQARRSAGRLAHHWPYTIDLLRGVDAAIDHPGRPGIYGMAETHRTMARFRAAFGTPAALGMSDVPALLRLPRADRSYLLAGAARWRWVCARGCCLPARARPRCLATFFGGRRILRACRFVSQRRSPCS